MGLSLLNSVIEPNLMEDISCEVNPDAIADKLRSNINDILRYVLKINDMFRYVT